MSGKGSRERRKEAVRRARADVYASNGDVCATQPFTCERQARIYEAAYNQWRAHYWRMERLHDELAEKFEADLPDGPEKSAGMRKLLEAKDCFVRAALEKKP